MAILLAITGRPPFAIDADLISIGSEAGVTIAFPGDDRIKPRHAVIRKVAGRWMVEAREADSIRVGNSEPGRVHWLSAGDVIHLVEIGPTITFQPPIDEPITLPPRVQPATPAVVPAAARPPVAPSPAPPVAVPVALPVTFPVSVPVAPPTTPAVPNVRDRDVILPPIAPMELADLKAAPARDKPRVRPMPQPRTDPAPQATPVTPRPKGRGMMIGIGITAGVLLVAAGLWFGRGAFLDDSRSPADPEKKPKETAGTTEDEDDEAPPLKIASSAQNSPSEKTSPASVEPPALVELQRSLYAVLVRDADGKRTYRLGTAWAAAPRRLVTSGAVVMAIEELQNLGLTAIVSPAGGKQEIRVTATRVHPAYTQAVAEAVALSKGGDEPEDSSPAEAQAARDKLASAYSTQAKCDLGVLETGQFPGQILPWEASPPRSSVEERFVLVGLPFTIDDYRPADGAGVGTNRAAQSPGSLASAARGDSDRGSLTMEFSHDVANRNWSGSPVLNSGGAVVGVYSRPLEDTVPGAGGAARRLTSHVLTPIGRLADFAPELR